MNIDPKKVCKGALALDPTAIVIVTRGPSGHIDVFASEAGGYEMLKAGQKHIRNLAKD